MQFYVIEKSFSFICLGYRGIITQAQPGDDYVSIDGKRTYFDIGPGNFCCC